MNVCFCEVEHDSSPPSTWCEPCQRRHLLRLLSERNVRVLGPCSPEMFPHAAIIKHGLDSPTVRNLEADGFEALAPVGPKACVIRLRQEDHR